MRTALRLGLFLLVTFAVGAVAACQPAPPGPSDPISTTVPTTTVPTTAAPTTTVAPPAPVCPVAAVTTTALVEFATDATANDRVQTFAALDADHVQPLDDGWYQVSRTQAEPVASLRERLHGLPVETLEPNGIVTPAALTAPSDPLFASQWALEQSNDIDLDVLAAWGQTMGSRAITVAIVDTGVEIDHTDLSAAVARHPGEVAGNGIDDDHNGVVDDVYGARFSNGVASGDPRPDSAADDHGTLVAGVIAAANNGVGTVGVAPGVSILPVKVIFGGYGTWSDLASGIRYAADRGAQIINVSLGAPACSEIVADAVSYARAKGSLVVAAAGNDGVSTPFYPASLPLDNVVSVGAIDSAGAVPAFTNRSPLHVDLGAPGDAIQTTGMGNSYTTNGGTSLAAPHVAGVAALVWSQHPGWTATQVRAAVLGSVDVDPRYTATWATSGRANAAHAVGR